MRTEGLERSASGYRAKFDEMRRRAEAAAAAGDETGHRTYQTLAKGWSEMIQYIERCSPPAERAATELLPAASSAAHPDSDLLQCSHGPAVQPPVG